MKTNIPLNDDEPLGALLREWKVEATLPPRFKEGVWRSIARAEAQGLTAPSPLKMLTMWIETLLPRPALAVAYVAVLLVAGSSIGWVQAQNSSSRVSEELSTRYVSSVDPYLAVR